MEIDKSIKTDLIELKKSFITNRTKKYDKLLYSKLDAIKSKILILKQYDIKLFEIYNKIFEDAIKNGIEIKKHPNYQLYKDLQEENSRHIEGARHRYKSFMINLQRKIIQSKSPFNFLGFLTGTYVSKSKANDCKDALRQELIQIDKMIAQGDCSIYFDSIESAEWLFNKCNSVALVQQTIPISEQTQFEEEQINEQKAESAENIKKVETASEDYQQVDQAVVNDLTKVLEQAREHAELEAKELKQKTSNKKTPRL